jgi:hypothetical protein
MIGYRFLVAAEEEMSEAAEFYEATYVGWGAITSRTSSRLFTRYKHIRKSERLWAVN